MGAALDERAMREGMGGVDGAVLWLTGPDAATKAALGRALRKELSRKGYLCAVLDGSLVESAILDPGAEGPLSRRVFQRTLARLVAMLSAQGQVVIVATPSDEAESREAARGLTTNFIEVRLEGDGQENGAANLRLPGIDVETGHRPELITRNAADSSVVNRIVAVVARKVL